MLKYYLKDLVLTLIPLLVVAGIVWWLVALNRRRLWQENFSRIWRTRLARLSLIVIGLYLAVFLLDSVAFPVFQETDGKKFYQKSRTLLDVLYQPVKEDSYSAPMARHQFGNEKALNRGFHLFGTNINGEDVLRNALRGIRIAFIIGGLTSLIILPLGLFFGLIAGYYGGKTDTGVTYAYSTLECIPEILLLIVLMNIFGNGIIQLCVALGITSWVGLCRITRGETLKIKTMEFVQASRALGHSHGHIIFRHILPNIMHIVLITAVLRFSGLVMAEVVLSYLGLGVPRNITSWGIMIDQARGELARDPMVWWNITAAFSFMFILILAVNFFGDAARDVLDPRTRKETGRA